MEVTQSEQGKPKKDAVSDERLRAMLWFYSRNWPGGELARALAELVERREKEKRNATS